MEESVFMDGVRSFFAMLDRMVYSLITVFYNTISDLASAQLVNSDVITTITSRFYALLSIFMIFKVSFSLINYIVNPDMISDKTKGGGTLIKNIVIMFALIVSTPFAFNLMYEAQSAILADQLIPRFLLGVEINQTPDSSTTIGSGYELQMTDCENTIVIPNMGNYLGLAIFKPFFVPQKQTTVGNKVGEFTENAKNLYCTAGEILGESSVKHLLSDDDLYNSPKGWSSDQYYTIDYSFGLSTAFGIVIALILLGFCFDIAKRAFKLLFLEIIAPIPIISYIDPDSSKSGMFIKWLKEVAGTWVSLFTRLASLFLSIFVIQQVTSNSGKLYFLTGYEFNGSIAWIKILIIIGALMFAKELPKILENILGFQLGGAMTLNPLKKLEGEMAGGSAVGAVGKTAGKLATGAVVGVGVAAGTALGSGIANAVAAEGAGNKFKGFFKGIGTGAFYGATDGFKAGFNRKGIAGATLKSIEHNSRNRNLSEDLRKAQGGKGNLLSFMAKNKLTDIAGVRGASGTTDMLKDQITGLNKAEQQAMLQQREATQTMANLKSQYTQFAAELSGAFKREFETKNGIPIIEKGIASWKGDSELRTMTAADYIKKNGLSIDASQMSDFENAFNAMKEAELQYRDAYNAEGAAKWQSAKLAKQQEKIGNIGKP